MTQKRMVHRPPARDSRVLLSAVAALSIGALVLTGCAGADDPDALDAQGTGAPESGTENDGAPTEDSAETGEAATVTGEAATVEGPDWPRTVTLGEQEVVIEQEPQAVVALSTETGDITLELAGPERVAAVTTGSATEGTGNAVELAQEVETVFPPGTDPDPEQVLALEPDLVLITGRHDGEDNVADILAASGVPALVFDTADFATPDAVADSVRLLGVALGEDTSAAEQAEAIEEEVLQVQEAVVGAEGQSQPRTVGLMARGNQVMVTGMGSTLTSLAEQAGGASVAEEMGWRGAVPVDAELLLAANPDVILIEDFQGAGIAPFEDLLASSVLAEVPAIAQDEVHLIPGAVASGTAGLRIGEGLRQIAEILHPEQF
ncbi:ABC transporter substrate-binding protein [Nesterenkonia flava]|uniref:ABC transporter substrate-binding protein n=1 Tax=Nesterenkonia flava TaxID=469799 RepID=A0ABU1FRE5_9MICC|nr:ABC transporter substrate-binding protein [Nesterenkonia flava]MDR5710897.1 ABC transporter substrate-binding protein [Nesterenkonia flava]